MVRPRLPRATASQRWICDRPASACCSRPRGSTASAPGPPRREPGRPVDAPEELRARAAGHGGGDVFVPQLLADPRVAIRAGHAGGALVSGAIGSLGASVVGVSNVFTSAADLVKLWRDVPRAIAYRFPGLPLVGYEAGADLEAALR